MRKIGIACFTERGALLADRLEALFAEGSGSFFGADESCEVLRYEKNLREWCGMCFAQAEMILFIGACGIAVRSIAPFLKSKTTDPAVLVLDEGGQFVISLLSGHIGGANAFAREIAARIGAIPVITTSSDVNGKIAVDVFAKKNGLAIGSMTDAKRIAAAILRGKPVGVYCSGAVQGMVPPELTLLGAQEKHESVRNGSNDADLTTRICTQKTDKTAAKTEKTENMIWISPCRMTAQERERWLSGKEATVLHLIPRSVVLGVGCRRGKTMEEIRAVVQTALEDAGIAEEALICAASIDLKKEEDGILKLCSFYGVPYNTYAAEELAAVSGDFSVSDFVKKTTGVDNVCERAALLAAGSGGVLLQKKVARDGVTVALACRTWGITF